MADRRTTELDAGERHMFRHIERGLYVADPVWARHRCPRYRRRARVARATAAVTAAALVVDGSIAAQALMVRLGTVLGVGALTSYTPVPAGRVPVWSAAP